MSTALERAKAQELAHGGVECPRCDAGWYELKLKPGRFGVELIPEYRCSICGYIEAEASTRQRWWLHILRAMSLRLWRERQYTEVTPDRPGLQDL